MLKVHCCKLRWLQSCHLTKNSVSHPKQVLDFGSLRKLELTRRLVTSILYDIKTMYQHYIVTYLSLLPVLPTDNQTLYIHSSYRCLQIRKFISDILELLDLPETNYESI